MSSDEETNVDEEQVLDVVDQQVAMYSHLHSFYRSIIKITIAGITAIAAIISADLIRVSPPGIPSSETVQKAATEEVPVEVLEIMIIGNFVTGISFGVSAFMLILSAYLIVAESLSIRRMRPIFPGEDGAEYNISEADNKELQQWLGTNSRHLEELELNFQSMSRRFVFGSITSLLMLFLTLTALAVETQEVVRLHLVLIGLATLAILIHSLGFAYNNWYLRENSYDYLDGWKTLNSIFGFVIGTILFSIVILIIILMGVSRLLSVDIRISDANAAMFIVFAIFLQYMMAFFIISVKGWGVYLDIVF